MTIGSGVQSDALHYPDLRALADRVFQDVLKAAGRLGLENEDGDWLGRSCAYWHLALVDTDVSFGALLGGEGPNYDRREKYALFAQEKAFRLELMIDDEGADAPRHLTSWESRKPEEDQWGGAVVLTIGGTEYIFSMSGIPEEGDEAFNLILAEAYRPTDRLLADRTMKILERTKNPYYERLRSEVFGSNRC